MSIEGPSLETLLLRIANTPEEFLEMPRHGRRGTVHVDAVVADLCRALGHEAPSERLDQMVEEGSTKSLAVTLILCWLLADEAIDRTVFTADVLLEVLNTGAKELAEHTPSTAFLKDPERREELARFTLKRVGLRPKGEAEAQAEDRLTSLSAAERARVLEASRAAEARARAVREALARKAAEESADKYSRE
jgi:hypothetical protein